MNDQPQYIADPAAEPPQRARRPVRWQFIVLGIGLLMIAAAGLYALLGAPTPVEAPPDVQPVSFVEARSFSEAAVGQPALVNPLLAASRADRDLASLVFSGLTRLDEFGQPIPDLATGWEVSPDQLTYTFTLRDGVTWHDGEPFTADDVAFTMSLLRDPDFPGDAGLGAFWRTVETYVVDDKTVEFVLTQPLSGFPEYAGIGVLPAHLLANVPVTELPADPFNLAPVGTGRLHWQSSEDVDGVTVVHLVPYDGYYDAQRRIELDEVTMRYTEDSADAFRSLGPDAQAMGGLTGPQLDAALGSRLLNVYSSPMPVTSAIIFNQQATDRLPFFQEEAVRQALVAAVDRPAIVAEVLGRQAVVADSPIMPGSWAYNDDTAPLPYNPEQAAALLDEEGWALQGQTRAREEVPLAFTLLVSSRPTDVAIGEAVAEAWSALGIDVEVEAVDAEEMVERLQRGAETRRSFDAALIEFGQGGLADPDPYPFWHEAQIEDGQNYSGIADRDISEALEIARKDTNGVRRAELYRDFQQWFNERAVALLLYHPLYHYAVSCQVEGVQVVLYTGPSDRFRTLDQWSIATGDARERACGDGE